MALVIEDGTSKTNANSYNAVTDVRSFASDRGIDLSSLTDNAVIALMLKATDYLETFAKSFVGKPTTGTQSLSWPRTNVVLSDGTSFPSSGAGSIPLALQNAESQLCIEQNNGIVLMPSTDYAAKGGFVTMQKVDVIETQWSERIGTTTQPLMPSVDRWLQFLLSPRPGGMMSIRV